MVHLCFILLGKLGLSDCLGFFIAKLQLEVGKIVFRISISPAILSANRFPLYSTNIAYFF